MNLPPRVKLEELIERANRIIDLSGRSIYSDDAGHHVQTAAIERVKIQRDEEARAVLHIWLDNQTVCIVEFRNAVRTYFDGQLVEPTLEILRRNMVLDDLSGA